MPVELRNEVIAGGLQRKPQPFGAIAELSGGVGGAIIRACFEQENRTVRVRTEMGSDEGPCGTGPNDDEVTRGHSHCSLPTRIRAALRASIIFHTTQCRVNALTYTFPKSALLRRQLSPNHVS